MSAPAQNQPGIVEQAKTLVSQAVDQATTLVNQAVNSQAATNATEQARSLGSSAAATASNLAGQAHAQAHAVAPSIVPAPAAGSAGTSGSVDTRGDLSPTNEQDRAKLDKLFGERADAKELQDKGILHGKPNDALAGKRHELERQLKEDKLEKDIAHRPSPEELVKKGILNADEAPPAK